jgi:hypothetical protein
VYGNYILKCPPHTLLLFPQTTLILGLSVNFYLYFIEPCLGLLAMNSNHLTQTPESVLMVAPSLEQDKMYVPTLGMLSAYGQDVLPLLAFVQVGMPVLRESVCHLPLEVSKY